MRLRRDIEIAAPIERVFEFIDEPGNYPALRPQIVRVLETQRLPHGDARSGI
jgi:ligand-binding SRPBCC domain-containing protein